MYPCEKKQNQNIAATQNSQNECGDKIVIELLKWFSNFYFIINYVNFDTFPSYKEFFSQPRDSVDTKLNCGYNKLWLGFIYFVRLIQFLLSEFGSSIVINY